VFLSNVPEGLAGTMGLRRAGWATGRIILLWSAIVAACVLAAVMGYAVLGSASPSTVALIQSFAAGAILCMLANTLMPQAYGHGGRAVGLVTVLGFIFASALAATGG
jgi:ZIP family zinc transporter